MVTKKKFFQEKIERVRCDIWELEFKLEKARIMRESARKGRDRSIEAMNFAEKTLEETKAKDEKKKVQSQIDALKEDIKKFESQMTLVDHRINGFSGDEVHEPVVGILEQIDAFVELREMYKNYIQKI